MGERNRDPAITEPLDDIFEPALGELMDEELEAMMPISS
jgi:hypothetical protein